MRNTLAVMYMLLLTFYLDIAWGQDLYVDKNSLGGACSDSRSRQEVSASTPWCTLGMAGSMAEAGDTVFVREGDYTEAQDTLNSNANAVLQLTVSGQPNNRIRILATEGEQVSITPQGQAVFGVIVQPTSNGSVRPEYIEIAGFEIRDAAAVCVEIFDTNDVELRDLDIHGCTGSAVEIVEADRVTLADSEIHDNPLNGNTSAVDLLRCGSDNVVSGNRIWGNTDQNHEEEGHGVIADMCFDQGSALIENNVIELNQGWCIVAFASDNIEVRNNTCTRNGTGSPTTSGQPIGEITTVGSFIDIIGNRIEPREGSPALSIRDSTSIWSADLSTINIRDNIYVAPAQEAIISVSGTDNVTVADFQNTYDPWGQGAQQIDPGSGGPLQGDTSELSQDDTDDSTIEDGENNAGTANNERSDRRRAARERRSRRTNDGENNAGTANNERSERRRNRAGRSRERQN